ncbi:MAG: GNAT family N-acetyltransferase [Eubacteriales bacterium]|jgi:GNAT superfamily N-acetyltransferase|nr:GNAT family N-acetyltransferase [Eubacteriales bacterium]
MQTITRCTGSDPVFRALIVALDEELNVRYGALMAFFSQHNHSDDVEYTVVVSLDGTPAGCGCFKTFSQDSVEMKRIFVQKAYRGQRLARAVLTELECWARECDFSFAVLETGILQPEAIRLYEAAGYDRIQNYPPYVGVAESVCFRKAL